MTLSRGRNTAMLYYEVGYSFQDKAPLERWYQLGGYVRMLDEREAEVPPPLA